MNNPFKYDAYFKELVPYGTEKNFKAWNSISINSEILGESTIRARDEIHLTDGFHAHKNSKVHIFPDQTFAECDDYQNFSVVQRTQNITQESQYEYVKNIELSFNSVPDSEFHLSVNPNPATNFTNIKLSNIEMQQKKVLCLKDHLGRIVYTIKIWSNSISLDLSDYTAGIYFVEVLSEGSKIVKKIVIT